MTDYIIRPYSSQDRESFLKLHSNHLSNISKSYVKWKFENNPFIDSTPIFVTEYNNDIVGARPYFALPLTDGENQYTALNLANTVVHPNHRKQGLLTKMTKKSLEYYNSDEGKISYVSPGAIPWNAYKKVGYEQINNSRFEYWRFQNPKAITCNSSMKYKLPSQLLGPIYSGYRSFADKCRYTMDDKYEIINHSSPPIDLLSSLYRLDIPERKIHVVRDKQYFKWRYNNPKYQYDFYIINQDSNPFAAIISGTEYNSWKNSTVTRFLDILPVTIRENDPDLILKALNHIISTDEKTDIYRQPGFIQDYLDLSKLGFFSTGTFPLSKLYPREGTFAVWSSPELDSSLTSFMNDYSNWIIDAADFNPY